MAILNLIGSSGEISRGSCKLKVPGGLSLSSTFRSKELNDVIQTFCPDYRRSFWDWRRLRRLFRPARLGYCTGGIGPHAKESTVSTNIPADRPSTGAPRRWYVAHLFASRSGRSVHQVSFEASLIP